MFYHQRIFFEAIRLWQFQYSFVRHLQLHLLLMTSMKTVITLQEVRSRPSSGDSEEDHLFEEILKESNIDVFASL
jgi:hypothetical protein